MHWQAIPNIYDPLGKNIYLMMLSIAFFNVKALEQMFVLS